MHGIFWLVIVGALGALLWLKLLSLVRPATARQWLAEGGKILDVRTPEEYARDHLPGAINVPLGELAEQVGVHAPDKQQPLLLHCLSGGRSALGRATLKRLGYTRVANLGSYARARRLVR